MHGFFTIFSEILFFFEDGAIKEKNELILEKSGVDNDDKNFQIRVYFENLHSY